MKRILCYFGAVIFAMIAMVQLSSCDKLPWYGGGTYDSVDTCEICKKLVEQNYTDVADVLTSRAFDVQLYKVDSIWLSIPDETLSNVAGVLLNKNISLTKQNIIKEYISSRAVYDNLQPNATPPVITPNAAVDLSTTDLGSRRDDSLVFNRSYKYRTDTINGKPVKIQIKTEESYVDQ